MSIVQLKDALGEITDELELPKDLTQQVHIIIAPVVTPD
jgi:hypothetical protein